MDLPRPREQHAGEPTRASVTMPTIHRSGPYRFYFYSHEPGEPPHVHVDRDILSAKFWLRPVALSTNRGFSSHELKRLERIVRDRRRELLEAWNDYFGV